MAKVPSKHSRDRPQDFEGLLNNLEDWELSFKDKDKKLRSNVVGNDKLDRSVQSSKDNASRFSDRGRVNGKHTSSSSSSDRSTVREYDYLKDYEALSRLSSGAQLQENFVDANSEKELGNEYFKQKKFNEAIDCYSRSIALSPTAVAYANRAMAYIKIRRFQEAENDCSEALNLDDRYIKAYSRRSTARKELGKLKESIDDAEFALRLEPQNQEIKKQYAESKSLLEKEILKKASATLAGKSKVDKTKSVQKVQSVSVSAGPVRRVAEVLEDHHEGIHTREVAAETSMEVKPNSMRTNGSTADTGLKTAKREPKNSKQELGAYVHEVAAKAANLAKAEAAKNIVAPNSAYQFEVSWRGLSGDRDLQARLLKVTSPTALPGIFKNALSAPILVDIVRCIATFFVEDMGFSIEYLQSLTKIPRFDMLIMCLSAADKADIVKIWDEVFSTGTAEYAEILASLRSRYGIKQ